MNHNIIKILEEIVYWDTCPDEYKQEIKRYLKSCKEDCEHPRDKREYIGMGELRCTLCGKEFK